MLMPVYEVGFVYPLHIREERLPSAANISPCRILYISDIHLRPGRSDHLSAQIINSSIAACPDLILLGGDLIDRSSELARLSDLVSGLRRLAPVFAVAGNHDAALGTALVQDAVTAGNAEWIHDTTACFVHGTRRITISGPDARDAAAGDVKILCGHNPRIWRKAQGQGYDLVLAGHLHGCQVVLFKYRDRLFPGAWFYPYCFLSHHSESGGWLVVSRGVSDLIPVRWRCPREVVLCLV